jgi:hypothetical protein
VLTGCAVACVILSINEVALLALLMTRLLRAKEGCRVDTAEVKAAVTGPVRRDGKAWDYMDGGIEAIIDKAGRSLVLPTVEHIELPDGHRSARSLELLCGESGVFCAVELDNLYVAVGVLVPPVVQGVLEPAQVVQGCGEEYAALVD